MFGGYSWDACSFLEGNGGEMGPGGVKEGCGRMGEMKGEETAARTY